MEGLILAAIPSLLVLVVGMVTKRIILSLAIGIVVASFIAGDFSMGDTLALLLDEFKTTLEIPLLFSWRLDNSWNLMICFFLLLLGGFVLMLQESGGTDIYASYMRRFVKKPKHAEIASLVMSKFLFVDDYLSSITTGTVMRPITDKHKIPRAKLAFLVDSMAAPLAILCPFSTWVAAVLGFLRENGISEELMESTTIVANPLLVYFNIIPYIFYSFLMVFAAWLIVLFGISYGKMHKLKVENTEIYDKDDTTTGEEIERRFKEALVNFLLPIGVLVVAIMGGFLWSGGYKLLGGVNGFSEAMQNANAAKGLFYGGIVAIIITTSYLRTRGKLLLKNLPDIFVRGVKLMLPSVVILVLAWILGDLLRVHLHTGKLLADLFYSLEMTEVVYLPIGFFLLSLIVSSIIGSSWGASAIIIPIALPMTLSLLGMSTGVDINQVEIIYPILGAILSGAIAGDHISPISDTTVMTATSTKANHMEHVYTQFEYALPVIIGVSISYIFVDHNLHILPGILFYIACILLLNKKVKHR